MIDITVTLRDGATRFVAGVEGQTLMEALRAVAIPGIDAVCGGNCVCATCHVYVDAPDPSQFGPIGQDEADLLDCSDHRSTASRLSCQVRLSHAAGALEIRIPPPD